MTSHRFAPAFAAAVLSLGLIAGCRQNHKKPDEAVAPPAAPDQVASLRESIQKARPGSLVGIVIDTLPDTARPYTAVGDIAVQDAKVGQTVTFVDSNGQPFNAGTVQLIVGDQLHIRYDPAGKRAPQKGDLAVILKE